MTQPADITIPEEIATSEEVPAAAAVADDGDGDGHGGHAQFAHEKAREGIEHLQAAARELIAAARAALDVAEDLIEDPDAVASLTGVVGGVTDAIKSVVPMRRHRGAGDDDDPSSGGIHRIPVT